MTTTKDIAIAVVTIAVTVIGLFFINRAFASIDTTEEIRTNVNGYKCVTFVYHNNHMFGESDQTHETFCKD